MEQCETCGRMVPAVFLTCGEYLFHRKRSAKSKKHSSASGASGTPGRPSKRHRSAKPETASEDGETKSDEDVDVQGEHRPEAGSDSDGELLDGDHDATSDEVEDDEGDSSDAEGVVDPSGIDISTAPVKLSWRGKPRHPPKRKLDSLGQPLPGDPIRQQQELEALGIVRPRDGLSCIDCRSAIKKFSGIGTTSDQLQSQVDAICKWALLRDVPSPITAKVCHAMHSIQSLVHGARMCAVLQVRTLVKALKSNLVKDGVTPVQAYRIPMSIMRTISRGIQTRYLTLNCQCSAALSMSCCSQR